MNFDRSKIIEIVGLAAVVASLIFVGIQLYLDRKLAIATQYASRAESIKADIRTQMESETYLAAQAALWEQGNRPSWWTSSMEERVQGSGLTLEQVQVLLREGNIAIIQLDNLYFQYQQGFLTEEFWEGALESIRNAVTSNVVTAGIYLNRTPRLPISAVVEEILNGQ